MTDEDIEFIERELGITLPESYKRALVPFGVPALTGNTDYELWDDARRLVVLNQELRSGTYCRTLPAWPHHLYAVGDPHGDEMIAIDTRHPDGPVWWLDHGFVEHEASYRSHARFSDWAAEFYRDMRQDLEGDGYDADKIPERGR